MGLQRAGIAVAVVAFAIAGAPVNAQQAKPGMMGMAHGSVTTAEMGTIHELMIRHEQITRTVTNLPDGIRATTESDDPEVAKLIKKHVAEMNQRVREGNDPGLPIESDALRTIFRNKDKISTRVETTERGTVVTQTSEDAETVAALQVHAAEVSDLARDGMAALHASMMKRGSTMPAMHGGMSMGPMGASHGNHAPGHAAASTDSTFAALQVRGHEAMGVDQYTSTHLFDALPDGGRIELQRDADDPAGVAEIRRHLREIARAFQAGDFSTPVFVHDRPVPGTDVMAAKREAITYTYRDLPRGGEVRLFTSDPEALAAIHAFMAFQRQDHRTGGHGTGAAERD